MLHLHNSFFGYLLSFHNLAVVLNTAANNGKHFFLNEFFVMDIKMPLSGIVESYRSSNLKFIENSPC